MTKKIIYITDDCNLAIKFLHKSIIKFDLLQLHNMQVTAIEELS